MDIEQLWPLITFPVVFAGSYVMKCVYTSRPVTNEEFEIISSLQKQISTSVAWESNEQELRTLHSLFKVGDFERTGPSWHSVGFQQNDPISDIRGGGCLAVRNLTFFLQKLPDVALPMCRLRSEDRSSGRNYPWAAASISITRMLCAEFNIINEVTGRIITHDHIEWGTHYHLLKEDQAFQKLFVIAFMLLDHEFECRRATYMDFPAVLAATRAQLSSMLRCDAAISLSSLAETVGDLLQTSALSEL